MGKWELFQKLVSLVLVIFTTIDGCCNMVTKYSSTSCTYTPSETRERNSPNRLLLPWYTPRCMQRIYWTLISQSFDNFYFLSCRLSGMDIWARIHFLGICIRDHFQLIPPFIILLDRLLVPFRNLPLSMVGLEPPNYKSLHNLPYKIQLRA